MNKDAPSVSIIMANYNGAAHIAVAVRSVLRQTERSLELLLSDDGSSDDSIAVALAAAEGDSRLIVVRGPAKSGPAAARNRALAAARGRWIAIVDSDDFIHPERLERLMHAAHEDDADIVADDLLTFYEDVDKRPHAHLKGALARHPTWISAAAYERSNRLLSAGAKLGYLKPLFKRTGRGGPRRYDETLRIGEDSDLILRLLIGGARMRVYPDLSYFYRKHAGSISHRLNAGALDSMTAAYVRLDPHGDPALMRALISTRSAIRDARAYGELVDALKARDLLAAGKIAVKRPQALRLLGEPIKARLVRRRPRRAESGAPRIALLSRQRIVGATNGSSAYVLAIAGALKSAGYKVDFIGASPKIFGRWALMRLRPDLGVFDRYLVHGGVRVGNLMIAADLRVMGAAVLAVLDRALGKLGWTPGWSKPADYAQGRLPPELTCSTWRATSPRTRRPYFVTTSS